jgi:ABC-type glycerol-3-phosphate transport system permease component
MKVQRTAGDVVFNIFNYTVFILFALVCVFPFYYIFINTISANDLATRGEILLWPRGIHFNNYAQVFGLRELPRAVFITISRTVLGTALSVICTAFVAFAITRQELWCRKLWYRFFIVTMYFHAGLIPWFLTMRMLGLTNNFWAYIVIGVISPFHMILIKTYIESIPASLQESAEMDGAGYLTVFFRILLPLCTPILATIAVFTAVGHWNAFMDTLFLMTDANLFTLQFILWQYLNEAQALATSMRAAAAAGAMVVAPNVELTPTSVRMTVSMVVVLPILFVYPLFQRFFIKGIMLGAVKG